MSMCMWTSCGCAYVSFLDLLLPSGLIADTATGEHRAKGTWGLSVPYLQPPLNL